MNGKTIALDRSSARTIDENGFLHVRNCPISKETVNPYLGREIPGWEALGLEPDRIYQVYRPGEELKKGAASFQGLPLLLNHHLESAETPQKEYRVGSVGTDAAFDGTYLRATLSVTDAEAIAAIESEAACEISCAYAFDPVVESGEFDGKPYEIVMTRLRGNHVALVSEGRAGSDVRVADAAPSLPVASKGGNPVSRKSNPVKQKKKIVADENVIEAFKEALEEVKAGADPETVLEMEIAESSVEPSSEENKAMDDEELEALLADLDPDLASRIRDYVTRCLERDAMDACGPKTKDMDPMGEEKKKEPAMDAALVKRQAKEEAIQHMRSLAEAASLVEPICGRLDTLAFDSAEGFYAHALDQAGIDRRGEDKSSYKAMVRTLLATRGTAMDAAFLAPSSSSSESYSEEFSHLFNIRVG